MMGENKQEKKRVNCKHCNYSWLTKSTKIYICCPSCHKKFKVRDISFSKIAGNPGVELSKNKNEEEK